MLIGGWAWPRWARVAIYSLLVGGYLQLFERSRRAQAVASIADVFDLLTYRERYEDLLARTGRDALTGVFDRGRLESLGRSTVDRARQDGRPVSMLLIDIDDFKSFNDRYGHAAGDTAIKRIAGDIVATVRTSDPVFRFGGEEFVAICEGLDRAAALGLGERIRCGVADSIDGGLSQMTVSIGIATCPVEAADYDALFQLADLRLYQAKAAGRNCVVGASLGPTETAVRLAYTG